MNIHRQSSSIISSSSSPAWRIARVPSRGFFGLFGKGKNEKGVEIDANRLIEEATRRDEPLSPMLEHPAPTIRNLAEQYAKNGKGCGSCSERLPPPFHTLFLLSLPFPSLLSFLLLPHRSCSSSPAPSAFAVRSSPPRSRLPPCFITSPSLLRQVLVLDFILIPAAAIRATPAQSLASLRKQSRQLADGTDSSL